MTVIAKTESPIASSIDLPPRLTNGRLLATLQLALQHVGRRRPQESKTNRAVLALGRMMQPMRLDDPLHVGRSRDVAMSDPLMDDHVVKTEVDGAIRRNARADPDGPIPPAKLHAAKQQQDRRYRKDQSVKI